MLEIKERWDDLINKRCGKCLNFFYLKMLVLSVEINVKSFIKNLGQNKISLLSISFALISQACVFLSKIDQMCINIVGQTMSEFYCIKH